MADENAKRDENKVTTLMGVTDDVSAEIRRLLVDPTTGRLKVSAVINGGVGDVMGPASSTDNAIVRFDGITGKLIQDSSVIIDDTDNITGILSLTATTLTDGTASLSGGALTGLTTALTASQGGTGRSSHTAFAVLCGGTTGTSAQQSVAGVGTLGQILTSNGVGALPTFQAAAGGGDALTSNPLSQFAATTSLQLKGVISDETGSGALVFGTSPTLTTPALGTPSAVVLTNATGTASSLTAGNVTTNANLTGHITSVGNAAVLGSFTKAQLNTAISDGTVLSNIVEDTTPQLGGELDSQANSIGFTMQTATGDGTTTVDWKLGNHMDFTFGAFNETFTFTVPSKPGVYTMSLKQDSVGSRTATWPGTVKWSGGAAPTLTTTATTGYDIVTFRFDGTNFYGGSLLDFS